MKKLILIFTSTIVLVFNAIANVFYSPELVERAYLGDNQAMFELSLCFRNGYGIQPDIDKANYWLERAANEGHPKASIQLNEFDNNRTPLSDVKRNELSSIEKREKERLMQERETKLKKEKKLKSYIDNYINSMVYVDGGTFDMGSKKEKDENPVHKVAVSSFWIAKTEVTRGLWDAVMGTNISYNFDFARSPIEANWEECQEFINKLNEITGKQFRLPTEAEWEYAARGGSKSKGYKYSGGNKLKDVGLYYDNFGKCYIPSWSVASLKPNELDIYDMSGGMCEWCSDWYDENYYRNSPLSNPKGPTEGTIHVARGGDVTMTENGCRVSRRHKGGNRAEYGFRLVLSF